MRRNILIVEDDNMQLDMIQEVLFRTFSDVQFSDIQTEHEFYTEIPTILASPPDLILMDLMLRWTHPVPQMPAMPDDVKTEGYYRAGIRCIRKIMAASSKEPPPILLFTVLADDDVARDLEALKQEGNVHVAYLQKTAPVADLIKGIRELVPNL